MVIRTRIYLSTKGDHTKIKLQNSLNINVNDLVNLCNNDLRKAINAMQSIAPLKEYDMNMIFGQINEEELVLFFTDKNFASKFMRMNYCIINFINQLSDVLFSYGDESCVSEFLIVLSDVEEKAALGCNDEILLSYLVTKRIEIFK
ncbi:hypothetical protein H312_02680 [Anncaliia algerae PRA339]|uniref:Uncharacterized protein n=1 Tax=Anncaliia algerae PRA339 TaxID=1288291 RepID=A0A059EYD0_9MICR|nr:hypothetical protein H312_02680 [Anncaliia algerae PRA339]